MAIAMLVGIAHATLHLAAVPDAHFSKTVKVDCALAAIDKYSAGTVALPGPGWTVLPVAVPVADGILPARPLARRHARAPPSAV